jgi:ABC-type dipeptide/oligopeptide/nickel transport system permease component
MRSLPKFLAQRVIFGALTLIIISIIMYGVVYFSPFELRVTLFMPPKRSPHLTDEAIARFRQKIIDDNHLYDPFVVQY